MIQEQRNGLSLKDKPHCACCNEERPASSREKELPCNPSYCPPSYFNHNHPLCSAYVLSFRSISLQTKQNFLKPFWKGNTAALAHHWHEIKLYVGGGEDQVLLADRATNAMRSDLTSFMVSGKKKRELGDDNGKDQLQAGISACNGITLLNTRSFRILIPTSA